jgi:hypothetical protein
MRKLLPSGSQTSHPGLLQEIQDAVQRCRDQLNEGREDDDPVVRDELAAEDEYHSEVVEDPSTDPLPPRTATALGDAPEPAEPATAATRFLTRHASGKVPGVR